VVREREIVLGAEHADVALSRHNLGSLLRERGELEKARSLLDAAVEALEAAHGADDLRTANAFNSLALLHKDAGDLRAAHRLLLRAAKPRVRQLGMAHPDSAATLHCLAELARLQGDEQRALSIQRDLLTALREAGVTPSDELLAAAGASHPPAADAPKP